MAKARQFLGVTPMRWIEYLVAILIGNAVYYFSLAPHLPEVLRHQGFQMDGGVFVDFGVCVAYMGLSASECASMADVSQESANDS